MYLTFTCRLPVQKYRFYVHCLLNPVGLCIKNKRVKVENGVRNRKKDKIVNGFKLESVSTTLLLKTDGSVSFTGL